MRYWALKKSGIFEAFIGDKLVFILADIIFCHIKVLLAVISALLGSGAGDISLEGNNEIAHINNKRIDILGIEVAEHYYIATRSAAHRTEINYILLAGAVAKIGCTEMLNGVKSGHIYNGLAVGCGNAHIKCSDYSIISFISAGNVKSGKKAKVVYGKACYSFHFIFSLICILGNAEG